VRVAPTGNGNINDTYLAIFRTTFSEFRFILQRLNSQVFKRPDDIMHNLKVLTEHVHRRLEAEADDADRIWQLPRIIPTRDGADFLTDEDGHWWRAVTLIASAESFERVQSPEHAHEAGVVLGQFHRLISDLPPERLRDTLPGFHETPRYLAALDAALGTPGGVERLRGSSEARQCERFIRRRRDWAGVLEEARARGELIVRPIHGDAKFANVMIDEDTGKGTCLIDLDTVKPGLVHYDFGDCLRSCCNPGGEETRDLAEVYLDTDLCDAIVRGYMSFAGGFLTEADRHYRFDALRLLTFELGVRFFADYIAGDTYFKTRYEGHNLRRALVQLKLCESIETREPAIRRIMERYA